MPFLDLLVWAARRCARGRAHLPAAALYEAAVLLSPKDARLRVQCGHAHKEAGSLIRAERHYASAEALSPADPDVHLQFGHLHKVAGRFGEAEQAYRRALELTPSWTEADAAIADLYRTRWSPRSGSLITKALLSWSERVQLRRRRSAPAVPFRPEVLEFSQRLVPELAPRLRTAPLHAHEEGRVEWRRFGRRERTPWGVMHTFRGIESLRGFCNSSSPASLELRVDGRLVHSAALKGYRLAYELRNPSLRKYVFNLWVNFSDFDNGQHELELEIKNESGRTFRSRSMIAVAAPLSEAEFPHSDALVESQERDPVRIADDVNARPSMVREARRRLFSEPPRSILVQRVDQLGDLVCSVPALRRLREIVPNARIVGLVSSANEGLARTLDVFDETISVDFPDDPWERRRVISLEKQEELRRKLATYKFDVAIDLSEANLSRPLLLLSGAPFKFGFEDDDSPWLSATYRGGTRDPINGIEIVPHTTKLMGFVEWFGALMVSHSEVVTRTDLTPAVLEELELPTSDYIVLHAGARLEHSRWPGYPELARLILERTNLSIVMLSDVPARDLALPDSIAQSDRVRILDRKISFDQFDALLTFCSVFVGNDSGPKHLASLRGAKIVSLHMARNNWREWGQENTGLIISRRVPCAGCVIHHDPEECGTGFACITHIRPDEVLAAVERLLAAPDTRNSATAPRAAAAA